LAVLATVSFFDQVNGIKMKTYRAWLLFSALLVVMLLIYYFIRHPTNTGVISSETAKVGSSSASGIVTATNVLKENISKTQATTFRPTNTTPIINDHQKTNEIRQYMESQNKAILFYGRVVDQDENPISDVKVKVEVRHIKVIVPAPWGDEDQIIPIEKETDSTGHFEVNGVTGDSLTIIFVEKEGYRLSPKLENTYGYGGVPNPFQPDPQNPVIIKMWKLGEPANLISHQTLFGFQPDGRVYTLDLLADQKIASVSANGDLRVQFQRQSVLKPKEEYPWILGISAVNGGLIETTDEFEYLAPENGYQPQVSFRTNSISPKAMPDLIKDFYFTSRNGQVYGVMSLQIFSDYNGQSAILVNSRVNPNGSRNLQP
jgi:hypothetical protein